MKNRLNTGIVMVLFATLSMQAMAQEIMVKNEPARFQKILNTAFVPSLESDIRGIVEGSLYNIVLCKKYFSALDYKTTSDKLQWLIAENKSSSITYKAHLVLMYLSNAENIDITPKSDPETHDYIFRQISKELESKLLANNDMLMVN